MRLLKIIILIILILVCGGEVYAQTFKMVGFRGLPPHTSQEKFEREKAKALGTKIYLETFPNDLKCTVEGKSLVYSKKSRNYYELTNPNNNSQKVVIKLNTIINYIKGGEVQYVNNGKVEFVISFERE